MPIMKALFSPAHFNSASFWRDTVVTRDSFPASTRPFHTRSSGLFNFNPIVHKRRVKEITTRPNQTKLHLLRRRRISGRIRLLLRRRPTGPCRTRLPRFPHKVRYSSTFLSFVIWILYFLLMFFFSFFV